MNNVKEILVLASCLLLRYAHLLRGAVEVVIVKAIGNQLYRSACHLLKIVLNKGRHGNNRIRPVKYALLQFFVPPLRPRRQFQMLEIEHPRPRITEIRHPRNAGGRRHLLRNEVHRVRRAGADNHIDRMLLEVFLQELHRRTNPKAARVGDEEIAANPQRKLLRKAFLLRIYRIDFRCRGLPCLSMHGFSLRITRGSFGISLPRQPAVNPVGLENRTFQNYDLFRNIIFQCPIHDRKFRILRSIYHRLPTVLRQIFRELHPSLHAGTSGRRPIVCDNQDLFHIRKITSFC